jgi:nitrite reductase (NADH) large subunit
MTQEPIIIVGAGMAATRFVEELTKSAPGRYTIHVIGEEPQLAYNRVLLSTVLAGEMTRDEIELKPAQWWRSVGVDVISGRRATRINVGARRVELDGGETLAYSKLVLATGSRAIRLAIPGADLDGVHTFRDVQDVEALARLGGKRVLVIGGGLLGLEAAYGLARRGAQVTLAHVMDRLMERQLDEFGAALLCRLVEAKGVRVLLNANTIGLEGDVEVQSAIFADGSSLDIDAVVFAVGVRANADLAVDAGLDVGRGVIVDDGLATSDPTIFAIGECGEHRGVCYGLVEPAYEHARVLARRLAGEEVRYSGSVVSTNLKVSGVRVFSAGDFLGQDGGNSIVCKDPRMGVYRKLVIKGGRLVGAILIGDTTGALEFLQLIRGGEDISPFRDHLMFGPIKKAA